MALTDGRCLCLGKRRSGTPLSPSSLTRPASGGTCPASTQGMQEDEGVVHGSSKRSYADCAISLRLRCSCLRVCASAISRRLRPPKRAPVHRSPHSLRALMVRELRGSRSPRRLRFLRTGAIQVKTIVLSKRSLKGSATMQAIVESPTARETGRSSVSRPSPRKVLLGRPRCTPQLYC